MPEISLVLTFDIVVVIICTGLLWAGGRLSAFHPAVLYLFCHVYTITVRLLMLQAGAAPSVPLPQVLRAAFVSDMALIGVTIVFLHLARTAGQQMRRRPEAKGRMLQSRYVVTVAAVALIIGLAGMWNLRFAGVDVVAQKTFGAWSGSSWLWITVYWPIQAAVMWHYIFGYRPLALVLTAAIFVLTALSEARFPIVIFGIFFCLSFLSRRGLRWPPTRIVIALAILAVVWFPLKVISASAWAGDDLSAIGQKAMRYTEDAVSKGGGDFQFLDEAAMVMTLVDEHGHYFYGTTLLPLLVSPVPRAWWPDKPALNQYLHDIQSPDKPIAKLGMISLLIGEGYANGGYIGAVLFPMLAVWCFGRAYFAAIQKPHNSLGKFAYLVLLPTLIQVFRDGLLAVVIFNVINSMPMMFVIYLHYAFAPRQRLVQAPAPRLAVGRAWL
jgi:hypothetical protein